MTKIFRTVENESVGRRKINVAENWHFDGLVQHHPKCLYKV